MIYRPRIMSDVFSKNMDRIETIYNALDQIAQMHGSPRPAEFGGGLWNFDEEIKIWKKQILDYDAKALTPTQWKVIDSYINQKRMELKK